jgi:MFS family permease
LLITSLLSHLKFVFFCIFSEENNEAQKDVQVLVNNFQQNSQWIASVPLIIFSVIAGALSDVFGRKPLILFPLIGYLLNSLANIVNYAFIETFPVEFFYLNRIGYFFGGYAVYFLGTYSYGSTVAKPTERTYRLSRQDGMHGLANIVGTLISPYVFQNLGFYGNYVLSAIFFSIGIAYLCLIVKEPIKNAYIASIDIPSQKDTNPCVRVSNHVLSNLKIFFKNAVIIPIQGMKSLLTRKRRTILKVLLTFQIINYGIYVFSYQAFRLTYLYMLLVFDDFKPKDYAFFQIVTSILQTVCLTLVMPILCGKLHLHDAMILFITVTCEVLSAAFKPFTQTVWQFYLANALGALGVCKWSVVRSLISKCVEQHEVGKCFQSLLLFQQSHPLAAIRSSDNCTTIQ